MSMYEIDWYEYKRLTEIEKDYNRLVNNKSFIKRLWNSGKLILRKLKLIE